MIGAALLCACTEPLPPAGRPIIDDVAVAANPHNVLSAIVSVRVRDADSVAVRFTLTAGAPATESVTPAVPVVADGAAIPVLGLLAASEYTVRVVAYGGGSTVSAPLPLTTGALPADLPQYTAGGSDPTPGYVIFATPPPQPYSIAIDNTGRVVWYRRFANGPGLAFLAQPTGRYVARPVPPDPTQPPTWIELDVLGEPIRSLGCSQGMSSRPHDLITEPDGSYWIMCDEMRTLDLTATSGVPSARVTGTAIQHVSAAGTVLFHWSPFDHFAITDVEATLRTGTNVNWTHGNALDFDVDGNLIVSFRSLGEITKINVATGTVMWRLGGLRNQFTFIDTPQPAFTGQHSARAYAPGALVLLDNLGVPTESRAEHYAIDASARTARLTRSYASVPGVVTQIGGSVQDLPGGRTLVSFGTAGRVEEYDATGRVVWSIQGNAGYIFRAQRIRSLYTPGASTPP